MIKVYIDENCHPNPAGPLLVVPDKNLLGTTPARQAAIETWLHAHQHDQLNSWEKFLYDNLVHPLRPLRDAAHAGLLPAPMRECIDNNCGTLYAQLFNANLAPPTPLTLQACISNLAAGLTDYLPMPTLLAHPAGQKLVKQIQTRAARRDKTVFEALAKNSKLNVCYPDAAARGWTFVDTRSAELLRAGPIAAALGKTIKQFKQYLAKPSSSLVASAPPGEINYPVSCQHLALKPAPPRPRAGKYIPKNLWIVKDLGGETLATLNVKLRHCDAVAAMAPSGGYYYLIKNPELIKWARGFKLGSATK